MRLLFAIIGILGFSLSATAASEWWDEQYEEWLLDPQPYGGLSVLQQIKEAKDSGATNLNLNDNNITDLTPLAGLTNLTELWLADNNISDLTPLAGLTNLTELYLPQNSISDSQKAMIKAALPNTNIEW